MSNQRRDFLGTARKIIGRTVATVDCVETKEGGKLLILTFTDGAVWKVEITHA